MFRLVFPLDQKSRLLEGDSKGHAHPQPTDVYNFPAHSETLLSTRKAVHAAANLLCSFAEYALPLTSPLIPVLTATTKGLLIK
jgi:hypothetical protein